ncbi:MAG: glycosyltransferase family 2 protein, partial [Actinobacteria bacterium]|nr:glycosyltransferase family 2 protein [Actinomycetota bacterium]
MAAQAETRPDVSVVIVTYNVCALLERCLGSLVAAAAGVRYEVIVVDNGSGDGTWPLIAARPDVRALRGARSLGFPRANNLGIACARGRHVLILNPDTELGPGALAALVRRLDMDPGLGIVGPRLRLPSGVLDPACRRSFPTWRSAALRLLRVPPRGWLGRDHAYNLAHESPDVECAVDAVSAACMLVRGDALRAVHGFDPGYFMYGEDLDLARRLRNAGWRAVYF